MENETQGKALVGEVLAPEQVAGISGGDAAQSCPTNVTVGTSGIGVSGNGTPSEALISIYEGFVDVTSHIIARLAGTPQ